MTFVLFVVNSFVLKGIIDGFVSVLIRVYPRFVSLLDVAPGRRTENEPRISADKRGSFSADRIQEKIRNRP